MRHVSVLADELQARQPLEQCLADRRALAQQDQCVGVPHARRQRIEIGHVLVEDGDFMAAERLEAVEGTDDVRIVIEDGDLHGESTGSWRWSGVARQVGHRQTFVDELALARFGGSLFLGVLQNFFGPVAAV